MKAKKKFKIVNPIGETEKELMDWKPDEVYEFLRIAQPHGFYVCLDSAGAAWHLHPEALQEVS